MQAFVSTCKHLLVLRSGYATAQRSSYILNRSLTGTNLSTTPSPCTYRQFSSSPSTFMPANRTPRPKQRVVREQKFEAIKRETIAKLNNKNRSAAGRGASSSSPSTTRMSAGARQHATRFASKNQSPEQVTRSKARQWKEVGQRDTLGSTSSSSSSKSTSTTPKAFTSFDAFSKRRAAASKSAFPPGSKFRPSNVSVTSFEKGSRNPQFEHSFAPAGRGGAVMGGTGRKKMLKGQPLVRTGNAGRDKAAAAEKQLIDAGAQKRTRGPQVRGFVPVRFALQPIESDVKLGKFKAYKQSLGSAGATGAKTLNADQSAAIDAEEGVFADPEENVQELVKKVEDSRFEDMGLHPDVLKGIQTLLSAEASVTSGASTTATTTEPESTSIATTSNHVVKPTEIQALTIPAMIGRQQKSPYTLCAAETGSGKTLAYLIPILNDIKRDEEAAIKAFAKQGGIDDLEKPTRALSAVRLFNHPRAIILLPSRELVAQVTKTLKDLSHSIKVRAVPLSHSITPREVIKRLNQSPVDIIVATPDTLRDYLPKSEKEEKAEAALAAKDGGDRKKSRGSDMFYDENRISMSKLQHLVIDEADSMFDRGFGEQVGKIVEQAKMVVKNGGTSSSSPTRITVVSATLPKKVSNTLETTLPGLLKITTPSLHKSLPGLYQTFLDLKPYFGNRQKAILDILAKQQQQQSGKKQMENTLIFCNTKHSCELLLNHLKENKVAGVLGALHGEAEKRDEMLKEFTTNDDGLGGKILISTDIASRGIDTTKVQHVVLYDFPVTIVDYLHRVGRTARGGRGGRATSLIGKKDRNLAERIMLGIRLGKVLS